MEQKASAVPLVGCLLTSTDTHERGKIEKGVLAAARNTIPQIDSTPYVLRTWKSLLADVHLDPKTHEVALILAQYRTFLRNFMVSTPDYRILGPRKDVLMVHSLDEKGEWTTTPTALTKPTPAVHGMLAEYTTGVAERGTEPAPYMIEIMDIIDRGIAKPPRMESSSLLPAFKLCIKFWHGIQTSPAEPDWKMLNDAMKPVPMVLPSEDATNVLLSQYLTELEEDEKALKEQAAAKVALFKRLAEAKQYNPEDFEALRSMIAPRADQYQRERWDQSLVRNFLPRCTQSWDLPENASAWMRAAYRPVNMRSLYKPSGDDPEDETFRRGVMSGDAWMILIVQGDAALSTYITQRCSDSAQRFLFLYDRFQKDWATWAQYEVGPELAALHPEYKKMLAGMGGLTKIASQHNTPDELVQYMFQFAGKARESVKMFHD